MWNHCSPISSETLKKFETAFDFTINPPLRDFLLAHNDGKTRQCSLTTEARERRVAAILDFSANGSAWDINRRMRKLLGNKLIVIGTDRSDNFICVRREMRKQELVVWNHISNKLEVCTMDIPMQLLCWQTQPGNHPKGGLAP